MLPRSLALALLFTFPVSVHAQGYLPAVPESLDLTGAWIIDPVRVPTGAQRVDRCDRRWGAETNYPLYSGARVELRSTGESRITDDGLYQRLHIGYVGTLYFPQGFASTSAGTTPDGIPGTAYNYECAVEILEYDLEGELELNLDDGDVRFWATGPERVGSPYRHGSVGSFGNAYYRVGSTTRPMLFIDPSGDVLVGHVGAGEEVNTGNYPEGCSVFLRAPFTEFSLSQCLPLGVAQMVFRRTSSPLGELPRGTLRGRVVEGLPDGTPTANPVPRAKILVYRQDEPIRPQASGESNETYAAYLHQARAKRPLVAETRPDSSGAFQVPELPLVRRTIRDRSYGELRQLYAVEVVGGELDEIDPNTQELVTLHFAREFAEGLVLERDREIVLRPNSALQQKYELAQRLIDKTPDSYTEVETEVLSYLSPFLTGASSPSAEQNEGVARALWAERAVAEGTELADALTTVAFDIIADVVADLLEGVSTRKQELREGRERLSELRDMRALQQTVTQKYSQYSPYNDGPGVQRITDEMNKLLSENPLLLKSEIADMVKKVMKLVLIAPFKTGLATFLVSEELAAEAAGYLERFLMPLIDRAIAGDLNDAIRETVKFVIVSERENFVDGPSLPFSVGARALPSLSFSRDRMQSWAVDNRAAYRLDRDRAADLISEYTTRGSQILGVAEYTKQAAEGFGAAADAFEVGQVIPAFRVAQKVTKAGQRLSQAAATILPITYALGFIPSRIEEAAYAAYGQVPPLGLRAWPGLDLLVAPNPGVYGEHYDAMNRLLIILEALRNAINTSNFPAALFLITDESEDGLSGAVRRLDEAHEALSVARTGVVLDPVSQMALGRSAVTYLKLKLHLSEIVVLARRIIFDSLAARDISGAQVVTLGTRVAWISSLWRSLDQDLNPGPVFTSSTAPAVAVTSFRVRSGSSVIRTSPETLTLSATIRNVSTAPIADLSAELVIDAPMGELRIEEATVRGIGTLEADDQALGGPDEISFEWTVERTGSLDRMDPTSLTLRVLESGAEPQSFVTRDRSVVLELDDLLVDADQDGLPDHWERESGLDPTRPDDDGDLDGDGLSNRDEWWRGTMANAADTDGDGLSDGEEVYGGADGWVTNPKAADTDHDGVNDGEDGAPLDVEVTAATSPPPEPAVGLSTQEIILTRAAPSAVLEIQNTGGGTLSWTAVSDDPGFLALTTKAPTQSTAESLTIAFRRGTGDLRRLSGTGFTIRVVDVGGATPDEQQVIVWLGERGTTGPDGGVVEPSPDGGNSSGPDGSTSPGRDGGTGEAPTPSEGCGCAAAPAPSESPGVHAGLLFALLLFLRRLRPGRA